MRVGVVGVGRIGSNHARLLREHGAVDGVVVTDENGDRAAAVAEACDADVAASFEQLLSTVDAVAITTPTITHADLTRAAIDAGLPVFCEKPIAIDLESTDDVIAHVHERSGVVQMGFQRRFDTGYVRARQQVRDGALGKVYVVRLAGHDPQPPPAAYIPGSGGIFRDLHIHDFDILRFVTGQEVSEVYADGAVLGFEVFDAHDDVDTAVAVLRLSGGTLAILSGTRHSPAGYDARMEITGSRDSVAVGWNARTPVRSLEPDAPSSGVAPYSSFLDRFADAYRAELAAFVALARGDAPNPCPPEEAREALRIALACDRSRAEHRPVALAEIG